MGLSICVGTLADLLEQDPEGAEWQNEALVAINKLLRSKGLPEHVEPTTLPPLDNRAALDGFPYSCLHFLRRFAAYAANPDWQPQPFPEKSEPANDPLVEEVSSRFDSHLLCHSDCEGYYVPIPFDAPLFADNEDFPGGILGSSQGLMKELVALAPKLGIRLWEGQLPDAEAEQINRLLEEEEGEFLGEKIVWLTLFEAARLSIAHGTLISFG